MKKLLVCLMAVGLAVPALAADTVGNGSKVTGIIGNVPFFWNYTDSTAHAAAGDASGNSKVTDVSRDRDWPSLNGNGIFTGIGPEVFRPASTMASTAAARDSLFGGASWTITANGFGATKAVLCDSTALIPTSNISRLTMFITAQAPLTAATDTSTALRIAYQIRLHTSGAQDSSNTFVWLPQLSGPTTAGSVQNDSMNTAAPPAINGASFGERIVVIPMNDIHTSSFHAGTTRGRVAFEIMGPRSEVPFAPYYSVRVRVLTSNAPTIGTLSAPNTWFSTFPTVTVSFAATPLGH